MLVAILIPVMLLVAAMLLEKFEAKLLDIRPRRHPARAPRRLEATTSTSVAQRHLKSVPAPTPIVLDVGPVAVVDERLPRAS